MALNLKIGSWRRPPPPLLGLDICSTSVKVAEISGNPKSGLRLERLASEPLERGVIVDGNIENVDAVISAVRRVLLSSRSKTRQVAMALPSSSVITKRVRLPAFVAQRERDLETYIATEAEQYIPFPLEEVNVDFQVIGPNPHDSSEVEVLLAAARNEKVEDRVVIAEQLGLKPVVMDADTYASRVAIQQAVRNLEDYQKQIIAVFDMGHYATTLHVILGDDVLFERQQTFGGHQLTQEIARSYGLSYEDAEHKKRKNELPPNFARDLVVPYVEQGCAEMLRLLQYFFTSTPYTRLDHIFLSGGASVTPGLLASMSEKLKAPVRQLNPFAGFEVANTLDPEKVKRDGPSMLVACGLALHRFDN